MVTHHLFSPHLIFLPLLLPFSHLSSRSVKHSFFSHSKSGHLPYSPPPRPLPPSTQHVFQCVSNTPSTLRKKNEERRRNHQTSRFSHLSQRVLTVTATHSVCVLVFSLSLEIARLREKTLLPLQTVHPPCAATPVVAAVLSSLAHQHTYTSSSLITHT